MRCFDSRRRLRAALKKGAPFRSAVVGLFTQGSKMEIVATRTATRQGRGPVGTLLYFDLQLTPNLRLKNFMLRRCEDGLLQVASPRAFGTDAYTFSRDFQRSVLALAEAAYHETEAIEARNDTIAS